MARTPLSAQEDTNRRMLRARDEMDRRRALHDVDLGFMRWLTVGGPQHDEVTGL